MTLLRLIVFSAVVHSAFIASRVAVSLYAIQLEATPFTIGTLMALYGLVPTLISLGIGRWVDRIGARIPMLIGAASVCIGLLLPFALPGLATLYITCTAVGIGFIFYQISVQSIVGFIGKPEDRPTNFSMLALSLSVSAFVGPLVTGLAIDGFGHRYAFLMLALFPVTTIVAISAGWLRLPHPRASAPRAGAGRAADLLRHRDLRNVFILSAVQALSWEIYSFMMPIYGTQVGLSASAIGVVMGSFAAATFVIRMLAPILARRLTAWRLLKVTMLSAAVIYALFPLVATALGLMLLSFALGMSLGCAQPMVMTLLHDAVPEGRAGEAVGIRATIINFTHTVMPMLFGALGSAAGVGPVFWVVAVAIAAGTGSAVKPRAK